MVSDKTKINPDTTSTMPEKRKTEVKETKDPFVKALDEAMETMFEYETRMNKQLRDYGTGTLLHMNDIHMIETIGDYPTCNLSELALLRRQNKSTVSRKVRELEKNGLICSYHREGNDKDVYYKLTESGYQAYEGHYAFHQQRSAKVYAQYANFSLAKKKTVLEFLNGYIEYLKDYVD